MLTDKMNKKGGTLTNWIFVIALVLLMVVIVESQIFTPMNDIYGNNYTVGLNTSGLSSFQSLKESSNSEIEGSEVSQTSDGLTLKSSWTVGKGIYSTLTNFINGNFISNLVSMLDLPEIVGTTFIVLIWIGLVLIIIYIFMKVVP